MATPDFLLTKGGERRKRADTDTLAFSKLQADAVAGDPDAIGALGGPQNVDTEAAEFFGDTEVIGRTGPRAIEGFQQNVQVAQSATLQVASRMSGDEDQKRIADAAMRESLSAYKNENYVQSQTLNEVAAEAGTMGKVSLGTTDVLTKVASGGGDTPSVSAFFGQRSNAIDRIAVDFAETVVSSILEAF